MKAEIKHLRNIIEKSKKDKASWISKTLDGLATEATAILSLQHVDEVFTEDS